MLDIVYNTYRSYLPDKFADIRLLWNNEIEKHRIGNTLKVIEVGKIVCR